MSLYCHISMAVIYNYNFTAMEYRLTNYIAIDTVDYKKAIAFYHNILGWDIVEQTAMETHLKKGNMNFFVADNSQSAYTTYFEYEVDDIAMVKTELEQQGCVLWPTEKADSYMAKDPYGTRFHVYQKGALL